ncbi:prepilin-type N-terminal cleavage/methylation domain-containing protein [Actinoplanes sp. NPDC024001]|uniref:PulJ/GspJ family protein n=1 Tax=Actinoplanes sp. NPDC024001 TaxID=3154598 RepID=UPI0033C63CE0
MRRRMRRRPPAGDQGYSLMEVLVTTGIMSVVLVAVLTATVQIYSGSKQIDQVSFARDQLDNSFRRVDRELRYATWISTPGVFGSSYYLEYTLPPREKKQGETTEPPVRCRQLIFDTANGALRLASWDLPSTKPGPPVTLAAKAKLDGGADPFTLQLPNKAPYTGANAVNAGVGTEFSNYFEMVRIRFEVQDGTVLLPFDSVFTSQNITAVNVGDKAAEADKKCGEGRPK